MPGIIAGVDGSPHSLKALDWALREAAVRQVPVTVLSVIPVGVTAFGPGFAPQAYPVDDEFRQQVEKATQEMADSALTRLGGTAPQVWVRAVTGMPADELITASGGADLLVVGARGAGGFARLVMGSVSTQVISHASCPVVVVPSERQH